MEGAIYIVVIAIVLSAILGYLVNQLPGIQDRSVWARIFLFLVVVAASAVVAVRMQSGTDKPVQTPAKSTATRDATATATTDATVNQSPEPSATSQDNALGAPEALSFSGDVILRSNLDFDLNPPQSVSSSGISAHDVFIAAFDLKGGAHASAFSRVAIWDNSEDPTKSQCADYLTRLNVASLGYSFDFSRDKKFCFLTDEERVVYFALKSTSKDGYRLSVKVWN